MDPAHWLVGVMIFGAIVFLVVVERHSRRRSKQLDENKTP